MVGSEPSPAGRNTTVGDTVRLAFRDITVDGPRGARPSRTQPSRSKNERSSVSPVSRATVSSSSAALLGLTASAGTVEVDGVDVSTASTADRYDAGLAYIPFDRHREGLMLTAPLWQNTLLGRDHEPELRNGPLVNAPAAVAASEEIIERSVSSRPTPTPRRSPSRVATSRSCSSDERW